jgi:hypothetical protein
MNQVWIFNGLNSDFPSAVFSTREKAEAWIEANQLEGTLTKYPIDLSAYDYAIANGWFTPKQDHHFSPKFIQQFTSASQEHFHYERENDSEQELDKT